MIHRRLPFRALLVVGLILAAGCDTGSAVADFEAAAAMPPAGITQTDENGNIVGNVDPDDWRTSPRFPSVAVAPAYPNPVAVNFTGPVQIDVSVPFRESIAGGLELLIWDPRLPEPFPRLIDRIPAQAIFQLNTLSFTRSDVQTTLNIVDPRGLYRLYIYDGAGRLVSYGDVRVE